MFFLCVKIKNIRTAIENKNVENSVLFTTKPYVHIIENDKTIAIDAMEEIFTNFAKNAQIATDIKANNGDKTTNIPAEVATPFPPLNPSHTGYTCPNRQQKTAIKRYGSSDITLANTVNISPFRASPKSVKRARILCPLLKTFVAPVLCEPTCLISTFP